jgi:glycosyltransferase involved in cell wall biosynthesis
MHIAFAAWRDLAHPQAGGSEVLVDRLAHGCLERGHEVSLLCGGPIAPRPYRVVDLGGTFAQYARAPLAHLRADPRPDVLVDVANGIPFFSPLWRGGPVVCLVHHVHAEQWRQRFPAPVAAIGWALERRGVPLAYRRVQFIAVSPSTASALAGLGIPPHRIEVVPNGVELPLAAVAPRARAPLFLALGRLVPHKRIDLLLRVWERVRPLTGGRLVIAGQGPERERLAAAAGPDVELLGAVSEEEKQRLLHEAWLLVHPAMHEGWGAVILEAAAAGTPALGFDVPGVRDSIRHDETGLLVASEAELAERWVALARDAAARQRLGATARVHAAAYSWPATVQRFVDVLARVVSEPRAGGLAPDTAAA